MSKEVKVFCHRLVCVSEISIKSVSIYSFMQGLSCVVHVDIRGELEAGDSVYNIDGGVCEQTPHIRGLLGPVMMQSVLMKGHNWHVGLKQGLVAWSELELDTLLLEVHESYSCVGWAAELGCRQLNIMPFYLYSSRVQQN